MERSHCAGGADKKTRSEYHLKSFDAPSSISIMDFPGRVHVGTGMDSAHTVCWASMAGLWASWCWHGMKRQRDAQGENIMLKIIIKLNLIIIWDCQGIILREIHFSKLSNYCLFIISFFWNWLVTLQNILCFIIIKNECHSNIIVDRLQGCGHSTKLRESESKSRSSKVIRLYLQ